MQNIYMPMTAAIVSFILLFVYLTKEKIKIKENNIYLIMLICIMLDSLLVSTIFINDVLGDRRNVLLTKILNRCDYVMLAVWSACLCLYSYIVLHKKDEEHLKKHTVMQLVIGVLSLVEVFLAWTLKLEAVCVDGAVEAITGPAVFVTFGSCAVNLLFTLGVIVVNFRNITKQIIPVFTFLGIASLCAVIYYFNPEIPGVSMGLAIVNLTMYFTIENPDVQMLEKVNLAKEQALKANQAKTDFLSGMSHEIRTPINAIVGFAECILNDKSLNEAQNDAKDIITASENLLELVNGILDISKIEAGRMEVVNKEYDLVEVSENLSKLIKARIGEKPIELRVNISKNIPGVLYGDESKIRQIMTNLLTNAVKYTDSGHIDFSVECVNADKEASLTISVSDTGQGIKEEVIGTLFDRFKRLEEDRNSKIEGTGLGLAITKQFAEMLGGTIEVSSVYGKGSTFTFKVSQKIISHEHKVEEKQAEVHKEYPGRKVLLVDDTAMNLIVGKRFLELTKVEVDTAASGEECIEKCKSQNYELILLDDMMPKMTGTETLKILKKLPSFNTPVVAFTANAIDGMRENYLNEGYSDYLSKPMEKSELSRVLESVFG